MTVYEPSSWEQIAIIQRLKEENLAGTIRFIKFTGILAVYCCLWSAYFMCNKINILLVNREPCIREKKQLPAVKRIK